jgi:LemA protein
MTQTLIVLGALALLALYGFSQYNKLVKLKVAVDEAFAQIEVQLKRRADLIPNLVETVKGYAAHESTTLEKVVQARAAATSATTLSAVASADGMLTQALRGLLAVAENYPDLKATTENKVGFARQFYNDNVRVLNSAIVTIPTNLFVGLAKVSAREFYEIDDPQDRKAPTVAF